MSTYYEFNGLEQMLEFARQCEPLGIKLCITLEIFPDPETEITDELEAQVEAIADACGCSGSY